MHRHAAHGIFVSAVSGEKRRELRCIVRVPAREILLYCFFLDHEQATPLKVL